MLFSSKHRSLQFHLSDKLFLYEMQTLKEITTYFMCLAPIFVQQYRNILQLQSTDILTSFRNVSRKFAL